MHTVGLGEYLLRNRNRNGEKMVVDGSFTGSKEQAIRCC